MKRKTNKKRNDEEDDKISLDELNEAVTKMLTDKLRTKLSKELDIRQRANRGTFYLRIGAVGMFAVKKCCQVLSENSSFAVFGVGSMIYSGLEFAQYFEMSANPLCDGIMLAVQPASRMMFTFVQMYFVFLNAKVIKTCVLPL